MRMILAALVLGLMVGGPAAAQEDTITVMGDGQVAVEPDLAHVRVGVTTDAGTAAEALASNSAAMQQVMDRIESEGVEPRDIQTSTLELGPRYSNRGGETPQVEGYTARNVLTVRVRDLDRLGAILDAAASDGANTFEGISFGLAEPDPVNDEALRLAVADARRKAELLADEAGVALGAVRSIDATAERGPRPMEMATARMESDSVPVARGELEISGSVTMVFAIGE